MGWDKVLFTSFKKYSPNITLAYFGLKRKDSAKRRMFREKIIYEMSFQRDWRKWLQPENR